VVVVVWKKKKKKERGERLDGQMCHAINSSAPSFSYFLTLDM
jgi:hypothetical protein